MGAFERDPEKIADVLAAWLGPQKGEFEAMAVRAKAIGERWQNALFRIVEDLAGMVNENPLPTPVPQSLRGHNNSLYSASPA